MSDEKKLALHWLVVGYVSPKAEEWIKQVGGQVRPLSEDPRLVAVGLAYNPAGVWVWSKGRQEYKVGLEFWNTGEIQEASTGITLQYKSVDQVSTTEYCSVTGNYIILPDEEFDVQEWRAKLYDPYRGMPDALSDDDLLGLDDHPF